LNSQTFLRRFIRDRRGITLDYSLSLFIFVLSVAFTLVVVTQYLEVKHSRVGEIHEKLASLKVMDDLCGSPGWMGGRSNWETMVSRLDLEEKLNDQSFFLGLRKNDRYWGERVVVPSASDGLFQTASESAITSAVGSLEDQGVMAVLVAQSFRLTLSIDTLATNPSYSPPGAADNATTHEGNLYAGADYPIYVTDTKADGSVCYDTVFINGEALEENDQFNISGRDFTVHTIDQERVQLITMVDSGYLIPRTDAYSFGVVDSELSGSGIKYILYQDVLSGGCNTLEYALFCREDYNQAGRITDLSINKIRALRDDVPYEVAKSLLGIEGELNIRIETIGGGVLLEYGELIPVGDTSTSERRVEVEGVGCTVLVNVW